MALRGIRGATTVNKNSKEDIWSAAQELVTKILSTNELAVENICAVIFSSTKDLTAGFPSTGVRRLPAHEFEFIPLFDTQETSVDGDLPRCIRVLLLVDTNKKKTELLHVYLNGARKLRPDLVGG